MENNVIDTKDSAPLYFSYLKLIVGSLLVGVAIIVWFFVIPESGLALHGGVYRFLLDNNFGINLNYKLRFYDALFFTIGACFLIFRKLNYYQTAEKFFRYGVCIQSVMLVITGSFSVGGGEFVIFGMLFLIALSFIYLITISWILILLSYIFERNQKKDLNLFILFTFIIIVTILLKLFIRL